MNQTVDYPLGAAVTLDDLGRDPYPIYGALQEREPVSWVPCLNMWYVTRYADVEQILRDDRNFTTASDHSTIFDTFGAQMLTVEGALHEKYKAPLRRPFMPKSLRERMEDRIRARVTALIDDFAADGSADLRGVFASRLPVQVTLLLFGLPLPAEAHLRRWYDSFERALSNFTWDPAIRMEARPNVAAFHALLQAHVNTAAFDDRDSILPLMMGAEGGERLSDDEIRRNASIIFFGGISTVEALILNSLHALLTHPEILARVLANPDLVPRVIEETMRWQSPVQSATRHVVRNVTFRGVTFREGETVNCMLGGANRDPRQFERPHLFDIDRPDARRHLGFAAGPHHCLGSHLAKLQCGIAVQMLLERLGRLRLAPGHPVAVTGYEFRQPRAFRVIWDQGSDARLLS